MGPEVIAAIIVGVATVVAALIGRKWGERRGRRLERQLWVKSAEAAPLIYAGNLSRLIEAASNTSGRDVVVHARAIVETRDALRGTLVSLSRQLNSQIDRLAEQVSQAEDSGASVEPLRETIQSLKLSWPSKIDQFKVEIGKLLTELGFAALYRGRDDE